MNHLELTATVRKNIKAAGVKARCRKMFICGCEIIQVYTVKHGMEFTHDDQRKIKLIATSHGLTGVRGIKIDVERMTDPQLFEFYL